MSYRIELRNALVCLEDGFSGTVDIDDASINDADATLLLDAATLVLHDDATIVPVGARFTTVGLDPIRTVTAQNANAQWQVTIGVDTTGTFTLTFQGETTAAIQGTCNAADIQAALTALDGVESGDLLVSGTGPFVIEARQQYLGLADLVMTATPTGLDNFVFAQIQDGGSTWSITFTPALDLTDGALPLTGDEITFLPQRVYMKTGGGNFEATINKEYVFDNDRGVRDGFRAGEDQRMDLTTSFVLDFLRASSGGALTVYEALNQEGGAVGWHNAAEDPCEPYCTNVVVIHRPPCGSSQAEVMTFPRFCPTAQGINIKDANVTLTGKCDATKPAVTREDASLYADLFD